MEGLGTGTSLETLLQESQQHTVLLSDLRENSEVRRKTDEKTLSQLQKLQQAASQTLEVAKAHKQQSKESSTTLKAINEATVNANAINAKRQTSALNTLSKTIDVGLNVVNQKMFSLIEKLGSGLAGAFASVGKSLENKLYGFMGDLSILVRPIIGVVKLSFNVLTKALAVPLNMIWTGLKAFSNTLIGKLVIFGGMLYLGYKFITGTKLGNTIANAVWDGLKSFASSHPFLTILTSVVFLAKVIAPIVNTIKGVASLVSWIGGKVTLLRGAGGAAASAAPAAGTAAKVGTTLATSTALAGMSKSQLRKYINDNGGNITKNAAGGMSREQMLAKANTIKPVSTASTLSKFGKFVGGKGNITAMLGGVALDTLSDNVENKTARGLMNVGSAALSGAATGAMIGSIIPGIGTGIGAALGGLIGAGGSLIAGEGGKKLFGSGDEQTEMDTLTNLQEQQAQSSNAQIRSLDDIAESIRESNKTLTRVVEKMSTDAQQDVNRREATTTEQARHSDAIEQLKKTDDTNELLQKISDSLKTIASVLGIQNTQTGKTSKSREIAVGNAQ